MIIRIILRSKKLKIPMRVKFSLKPTSHLILKKILKEVEFKYFYSIFMKSEGDAPQIAHFSRTTSSTVFPQREQT